MFLSRNPTQASLGKDIRFVVRPTIGTAGRVPKSAQPWPAESEFIHLDMLTPAEGYESMEEMEAVLAKYMPPGKRSRFPKPVEPWHQAQETAYDGWEKKSARGRAGAATKALRVSTEAVDPYLLLAHDAPSWEEAFDLETQALGAAERLLGEGFLTTYKADFWKQAITRPYMRSRLALGYTLWRLEKLAESRTHFKDLLRLNPGDNQGARYLLVAVLLEAGERGEAHRAMAPYSQDALSYWAFNRALVNFSHLSNRPASRDLLRQALQRNPHVADFLLGRRRIASWELNMVQPGEDSEAIEYTHLYKTAWERTANALEWLDQQT